MSGRKTGYSPLNVENNWSIPNDVMFAYEHEKINILLSVLSIFLSFYDFNLKIQGFVYLVLVKNQLGFHRNVQVFSKGNTCIPPIQLFYIQTCPGFLLISK